MKKYFIICYIYNSKCYNKNYFYFSNYTYQSKVISIQIHSFPTLFHDSYHFGKEFLSLSVNFGISILYMEISTPCTVYSLFPVREECTHVPSIRNFGTFGEIFLPLLRSAAGGLVATKAV